MARPKSEFLKAMGKGWEIFQSIVNEVLSLGGNDEHLRRILTSKTLRRQIAELIIGTATKVSQFPVWKTVSLGTGLKTADDFRSALKQAGYLVGGWANDILGKPAFSVAGDVSEVDLVNVSVAELGFANGAMRKEIYDRAMELGLGLCPSEVGPQLRLQYKDQPNGEWLIVAMEPIADSDGDLGVFDLGHDGNGVWLNRHRGHPDSGWDAGNRFLFVRRK
ncbi:MAG TPA: hypothetical protein VJJ27_01345 [Candidatus Paceibacterota bacterium]